MTNSQAQWKIADESDKYLISEANSSLDILVKKDTNHTVDKSVANHGDAKIVSYAAGVLEVVIIDDEKCSLHCADICTWKIPKEFATQIIDLLEKV